MEILEDLNVKLEGIIMVTNKTELLEAAETEQTIHGIYTHPGPLFKISCLPRQRVPDLKLEIARRIGSEPREATYVGPRKAVAYFKALGRADGG